MYTWTVGGIVLQHACTDMLDTMTIALQFEHYAPVSSRFLAWLSCTQAMSLATIVHRLTQLTCKVQQLEWLMLHAIVLISTDGGKFCTGVPQAAI